MVKVLASLYVNPVTNVLESEVNPVIVTEPFCLFNVRVSELNVPPVTNVSLPVIPVKPLPSPTKVPLKVPPLNVFPLKVVAEIVPVVPILKVTALNILPNSIVGILLSKLVPSFWVIVNVFELKDKSLTKVSVTPVME